MRTRSQTELLKGNVVPVVGTPTSRSNRDAVNADLAVITPRKNNSCEMVTTPVTGKCSKRRTSKGSRLNFTLDPISEEIDAWDLDSAVSFVESKDAPQLLLNTSTPPTCDEMKGPEIIHLPKKKKRDFPLTVTSTRKSLSYKFAVIAGKKVKKPWKPCRVANVVEPMSCELVSIRSDIAMSYMDAGKIQINITKLNRNLLDVSLDFPLEALIPKLLMSTYVQFMYDADRLLHTRKFNQKLLKVHYPDGNINATLPVNNMTTVYQVVKYCEWLFNVPAFTNGAFQCFVVQQTASKLSMESSFAEVVASYGQHSWYFLLQNNLDVLNNFLLDRMAIHSYLSELNWVPRSLFSDSELRHEVEMMHRKLLNVAASDPHKAGKLKKLEEKISRTMRELLDL